MKDFPLNVPRISIGVRLLIGRSEVGEHNLNLCIQNPDGQKIMNADAKVNVPEPKTDIPEASFSFALNGQNAKFEQPGDYQMVITIDGEIQSTTPLYVRKASN